MFNVTIVRIKDLIKYIIIITIAIVAIVFLFKIKTKEVMAHSLEETVPTIFKEESKKIEKKDEKNKNKEKEIAGITYMKEILKSEISTIKYIETKDIKENNDNTTEIENKANEEIVKIATVNQPTEVVTPNPLKESFNSQYGDVKIKNQTNYELTEEMLAPDIDISNKNVVIFHTHTCESYTPSDIYSYTPTGSFRTTDLNFTVAKVGVELEKQLRQYSYNVIHDTTYHDYPAYNGSYTRSLETVTNILQATPSDIVIDLHRDAIGSRSDYSPTVRIGEEYAAQIMFVIGTNNGGLWHPNWNQNLKFAVKLQQKANEIYPGLFKPIMLTQSRYNQHVGKYANIMEVGSTGNTLEQCLISMKYLAKVIDEVMK